MKHIQKEQEPIEFVNWKNQEKEKLDEFISRDVKGSDIWEYFPSSCPSINEQEEYFIYYSKHELKEVLLNEQGFICCYCNQSIKHNDNTIIEHLKDKSSNPTLTLEYSNLLASCNGGQKDPKPKESYCDAKKNNKDLPLSPLDKLSELHFYFSINGKISFKCEKGEQTIKILNLDIAKLNRLRKSAIDGFVYDENLNLITENEAKQLLDKIYQKDKSNQFIEFCSAIKSVIKREVLNQKDE